MILLTFEQSSDLVHSDPLVESIVCLVGISLLRCLQLGDRFAREVRVGGIVDSFENRRKEGRMSREGGNSKFVHCLAS